MSYAIAPPQIALSSQSRTLVKGAVARIIGNCRNLSSNTVKAHTKQTATCSDYALNDVEQAIVFAKDIEHAKAAHAAEFMAVCEALGVLKGAPAADSSHPLVDACGTLKSQVAVIKSAGADDLQAADLSETIACLEELRDALLEEKTTIDNRYQKTVTANRKAFGAAIARTEDLDQVAALIQVAGTSWKSMLPESWAIEVPDTLIGKATLRPDSKLNSPDRSASVILTQCRLAIRAESKAGKNLEKTVKQKLAADTIKQIGDLMKGQADG